MKKPVKITLISLGSLLAVLVVAFLIVFNIVFSSERLTKIVRQYAGEFITCQTELESVDLTLFSNFPNVSLRINDFKLINPMPEAPNDTLLAVESLFAELDVMDFLKNDKVTVTGFTLRRGRANAFVSVDSVANFDIVKLEPSNEEEADSTSESFLDQLSLQNIKVEDLAASYLDMTSQMEARVNGINLELSSDASLKNLSGGADVTLSMDEFFYSDSLNYGQIENLKLKPSHLYYDGKNAYATIPGLDVEDQQYLLSGEMALLAHVWNMSLDGFDVKWEDERPTLVGVTRIDSVDVTMGKEDMMYINTGAVELDMPVTSTPETWTTQVKTIVKQLSFAMDPDGTLVDHMDIDTRFTASTNTDFNDFTVSDMKTVAAGQTVEGNVHVDMTDTTVMRANVDVLVKATKLSELIALIPKAYADALKGITVDANLDDSHIIADCELRGDNFKFRSSSIKTGVHSLDYADDTQLAAAFDGLSLGVSYPAGKSGRHFKVDGQLDGLSVSQKSDSMNLTASLPKLNLSALIQDDVIDGKDPRLSATFAGQDIKAVVDDTISVNLAEASGNADIDMRAVKNCIKLAAQAQMSGFQTKVGQMLDGGFKSVNLNLDALYDEKQTEVLDMLSPVATFSLTDAKFNVDGIPYPVLIPEAKAKFNKNQAELQSCQLNLGNSDLGLDGVISNINAWLKEQALLEGKLNLNSRHVDADQLMDLASGFGADSTEVAEASGESSNSSTSRISSDSSAASSSEASAEESAPFMVPKDVNFVVNTNVKEVAVRGNTFENVGGQLTCDDGVLVLEEMGFTSKAAQMQLTALYKSPRENNLFVSWNFHLLDIDIAEMIRLVPEIDTIVPMLKAFQGKAEFHLAGETGLFRDYTPKMSSLKAVAAIEGKDLTVLDNETFKTIKKYLFKDCTTNKIDTMSVELAVARKKMTLYPMLVGWDKYEAIISGTHTIVDEMPFNYNVSITKCPLVGGHLGLDITGNLDDIDNISFSLGGCKYANLYRPEKRNITQEQTLELKKLINTSLKRMVK